MQEISGLHYRINITDKRTMFLGEDQVHVTSLMLASCPHDALVIPDFSQSFDTSGAEGTTISFVWFLLT
jgi:hypothetical protein